jgi:RNA polymerase II subunit A small phosphatase-like protein
VLTRPGLKEFLKRTSELYELVIYTASIPSYANPILDKIDPDNVINHRLFREHCEITKGFFVKNLSKLGRSLKNVIIIDNTPSSYSLHPCNGIPVNTWISSKNDTQLKELIPILEHLAEVPDVRTAIKKIVKKGKVDYKNAPYVLNEKVKKVDRSFEER